MNTIIEKAKELSLVELKQLIMLLNIELKNKELDDLINYEKNINDHIEDVQEKIVQVQKAKEMKKEILNSSKISENEIVATLMSMYGKRNRLIKEINSCQIVKKKSDLRDQLTLLDIEIKNLENVKSDTDNVIAKLSNVSRPNSK